MTPARIATDLGAYLTDPGVWLAWLVLAASVIICLLVGSVVGGRVGLIRTTAGSVEVFGLALGMGVIACTITYAALRSGFGSAFAPAFVLLVGALIFGRVPWRDLPTRALRPRLIVLSLAAAVVLGMVYGITVSPSTRDGLQPLAFMDEAFYAVLGRQLQATGAEDIAAIAGLGVIPGLPAQAWYHWGEGWLAGLTLELPGMTVMLARHVVALPLISIATAATVGGLCTRLVPRPTRRQAAILGAFAVITLAPIPIVLERHFDLWARATMFMVTVYGFAFVVAAVGLAILLRPRLLAGTAGALLGGALAAGLIASHVLVAAAAAVGVATVTILQVWTERDSWRSAVQPIVRPALAGTIAIVATITWGLATGHGLVGSGLAAGAQPFTEVWTRGIILTVLGSATLLIGPIVGIRMGYVRGYLLRLAVGALSAVVVAAVVWGIRVADFNMYHLYFGTVAVVGTPVAVLLTVMTTIRARYDGQVRIAQVLIVLILVQGAIGIGTSMSRLYEFSAGHYVDVPTEVLATIEALPADAKLAYRCNTFEEVAIWDARLIAVTAHTDRPIVPMCFQADLFGPMLGQPADPAVANPYFGPAPQRALYPTATSVPTPEEVRAFLEAHGIEYVWTDPDHPDTMVPDLTQIISAGGVTVYRLD